MAEQFAVDQVVRNRAAIDIDKRSLIFLGLTVIDNSFGVFMTGVGVISLAGVVVNNAIVLIDYTNKLVARGMHIRDAIVAAGATRLRPMMLTTITTWQRLVHGGMSSPTSH